MRRLKTDSRRPTRAPIIATPGDHHWHAIGNHLGGLMLMENEPDPEWMHCDECGDSDQYYGRYDFSSPEQCIELAMSMDGYAFPEPWGDPSYELDYVINRIDEIASAANETDTGLDIDAKGLRNLLIHEINAYWAMEGLLPFNRARCIDHYRRDTLKFIAWERGYGRARTDDDIARMLVSRDYGVYSTNKYGGEPYEPHGAQAPTPFLGCLIEGRTQTLPEYHDAWLDLMERYDGWQWAEGMTDKQTAEGWYDGEEPDLAVLPGGRTMRTSYVYRPDIDDEPRPHAAFVEPRRYRQARTRHANAGMGAGKTHRGKKSKNSPIPGRKSGHTGANRRRR